MDLSFSEDKPLAGMKKSTRYAVCRSTREGVEVVEPDFRKDWDTFYELMKTTAKRNEFNLRRSRDYPYAMTRAMTCADQGRMFFATHEGPTLAATYAFTFGEKLWRHIYGASSNEKRDFQPHHDPQ